MKRNNSSLCSLPLMMALTFAALSSCQKSIDRSPAAPNNSAPGIAKPAQLLKDFEQVNLVANNAEYDAAHVDPTLLNG